MVEKPFYKRLEKTAEMLGTTPDVLISNALLLTLKELEGKERSRRLFFPISIVISPPRAITLILFAFTLFVKQATPAHAV